MTYIWDDEDHLFRRPDAEAFSYSEGEDIERRLLQIVREASDCSTFSPELLRQITDWPSEYHFSRSRHCLLRPLDIQPGERVLELGCGCGAMTRYLGETGATVVSVEGSLARARIAAARCRDLPNVTIVVDDLMHYRSEERFDWVLLLGVLEYAPVYAGQANAVQAYLRHAVEFLSAGGRLAVAIENKLGLKYFNGCSEDHVSIPFFGVQNLYTAETPQTFGKKELTEQLSQAGCEDAFFYYPFPDYKLPAIVLSDAAFADPEFDAVDLLSRAHARDYTRSSYRLFDEGLVYSSLGANGLLAELANSFLVVAAPRVAAVRPQVAVLATTYSVHRQKAFCQETRFVREGEKISVYKRRLCPQVAGSAVTLPGEILVQNQPEDAPYFQGRQLLWQLLRARAQGCELQEALQALQPWGAYLLERAEFQAELSDGDRQSLRSWTLPGQYVDCIPCNLLAAARGLHFIDTEWQAAACIPLGWVLTRGLIHSFETGLAKWNEPIDIPQLVLLFAAQMELTASREDVLQWLTWEEHFITGAAGLESIHFSPAQAGAQFTSFEQALQTRERQLQQLEEHLGGLQRQLHDKELRVASLTLDVANQEKQMADILSSKSWRLTEPLRAGVRGGKVFKSRLREGLHSFFQGSCKQWLRHVFAWLPLPEKAKWRLRQQGRAWLRRLAAPAATAAADFFPPTSQDAVNLMPLRVLLIAEMSIPQCKKYRVQQKLEMLEALGIECQAVSWTDTAQCLQLLALYPVVIFYRVPAFPSVRELLDEAKRLRVLTLWEVDDLIFERELLLHSQALAGVDSQTRQGVLEGAHLYKEAMLACDKGIASTAGLAEAMRAAGMAEVHVVENALDQDTLALAKNLAAYSPTGDDGLIRIVYGSGTNTHNVDFQEAAEALLEILQQFSQVRFRLIGPLELPSAFDVLAGRIEKVPFCSYAEYLRLLSQCQISIAPLEPGIFNDAKSNIKYLEASILKIPSVCSPGAAFAGAIQDGVNGFLCKDAAAWKQALKDLLEKEELRKGVGEKAYAGVMENYSPLHIARQQLLTALTAPRKQPLTVLAVNVYYAPRTFGGATIVAEQIARHLNAGTDVQVQVCTTLDTSLGTPYSLRRYTDGRTNVFGIVLPPPAEEKHTFDNPLVKSVFAEVLEAVKPQVVHFHSIQGIGVGAMEACVEQGIPYVVTLHDSWWLCGRQFMVNRDEQPCSQVVIDRAQCAQCVENPSLNAYRQERLRLALEQAQLLLAPSRYFAEFYRQNGFAAEKVQVHGNGIARPQNRPQRQESSCLRVAYTGGNTHLKGIALVCRALADLSGESVQLVVVDNTLSLGFSSFPAGFFKGIENFSIVPAYTRETMDEFFAQIDILLFPTQCKESFGLTVREALARGVWVISTDAGAVVEDIVSGENGFVIPCEDDGSALRQAILDTRELWRREPEKRGRLAAPTLRWADEQAEEALAMYRRLAGLQDE